MKDRQIFGDLVPYGKVWRTGANSKTKITFSDDVIVGDTTLKAGTYAILTIPNKGAWEVVFYTDLNGGAPKELDKEKIAATVKAEAHQLPIKIETFTISFDDITNNSASIGILWESTYVSVEFRVPTAEKTKNNIKKVMSDNPKANDYYSAAVYYFQEGIDIKQAKEWIDKAISMSEKPAFWQLRQQSLIYAKAGDKKGAIEAAKKSLKASEEAKNDDYIKMNKDSLKEWGS